MYLPIRYYYSTESGGKFNDQICPKDDKSILQPAVWIDKTGIEDPSSIIFTKVEVRSY